VSRSRASKLLAFLTELLACGARVVGVSGPASAEGRPGTRPALARSACRFLLPQSACACSQEVALCV
jgi:hypothetical protein